MRKIVANTLDSVMHAPGGDPKKIPQAPTKSFYCKGVIETKKINPRHS